MTIIILPGMRPVFVQLPVLVDPTYDPLPGSTLGVLLGSTFRLSLGSTFRLSLGSTFRLLLGSTFRRGFRLDFTDRRGLVPGI
jgi:hypothetical protein